MRWSRWADRLQPAPRTACFSLPDFYVWCGTMVAGPDHRYYLIYSRWPKSLGHYAWVSHSEICVASGDSPLGEFRHEAVILGARGGNFWDAWCAHNPTCLRIGGRYYLYYMGNTGDRSGAHGLDWSHRNNQRIGVASACHPLGPWERSVQPLIAPGDRPWDALCCSNPSVTQRPDGSFLMIYKGVARQNPLPFGGPVTHLAARADDPLGPFHPEGPPVFLSPESDFPAEDPFIFRTESGYGALVKDMEGCFTKAGKSLAAFVSTDGRDWTPEQPDCLVTVPQIAWEDGSVETLFSLERPQLFFDDDGQPSVLLCAADSSAARDHSFHLRIPLATDAARNR